MDKLKCGNRWHGAHQIPANAKIIQGKQGEGYYAGREGDIAKVKLIDTGQIIEVKFNKELEG